MRSSLTIVTPAASSSLVSLAEAKLALNLGPVTLDQRIDDQLDMLIEWSSAEIATLCNRTFARETVIETFNELNGYNNRIYLSRYPVTAITSISEDGLAVLTDEYNTDFNSGLITRIGALWEAPMSVSYTGGYDLPTGAPRALKNATMLLTREAYYAIVRGDATIQSVSHKGSKVTYFPKIGTSSSGSTPAQRAAEDLLKHFTRFEV